MDNNNFHQQVPENQENNMSSIENNTSPVEDSNPPVEDNNTSPVENNTSIQNVYNQQPTNNAPPTKTNNTLFILIVAILIVAIVGVTIYGVFGRKIFKTKTQNPPEGIVDDKGVSTTQKYTMEGYVFSFPGDIVVKQDKTDNYFSLTNTKIKYKANLFVDNSTYEENLANTAQFDYYVIKQSKGNIVSSKETTVSNRKWYIAEAVDSETHYYTISATKLDSSHIIVINALSPLKDYNSIYSELTTIVDNIRVESDTFAPEDQFNKFDFDSLIPINYDE